MSDSKVTIADVAEALGVSTSTVSRAISGKGRVGDDTRQRVLKYIEEYNYVPSAIAKGLAKKRTYNIGLSVPEDFALIDLPFFKRCMMGICKYASSQDYDVLITMTNNSDVSHLERMVNNRKVDGVILSRTFTEDAAVALLKEKNIPFVTIGSSTDKTVVQIDNDHHEACAMLTSELIKQGIEKIALLSGDTTHVVNNSRMSGYLDAMQAAGLNANSTIFTGMDDYMVEMYLDKFLHEQYDCILCMDDDICLRVLDKLSSKYIRVPEDIKVASFYNSSLLERYTPSVTTLEFDAVELGETACKILLNMIDEIEVPKKTLLDYTISFKESTQNK